MNPTLQHFLVTVLVSAACSALGTLLGLGLNGIGPFRFLDLSAIPWPWQRRTAALCMMNHDKQPRVRVADWGMRTWFVLATRALGWIACKLRISKPEEWGNDPVYLCDECFRRDVLPWAQRWAFRRI